MSRGRNYGIALSCVVAALMIATSSGSGASPVSLLPSPLPTPALQSVTVLSGILGGTRVDPDWPVYHQSPSGHGVDQSGASFLPALSAWTSPVLDGQLFGEPLTVGSQVVVATENDTVYSLALKTGQVQWSTHVATPVPSSSVPCGDIAPTVGITSTPVIDKARAEIFVVADEAAGAVISHHLLGLDLATGVVRLDQAVDPAGSDPAAQLQRPGLALTQGRVVISFGGNAGDCGTYHGWVVSVAEDGGTPDTFEVDASPGNFQGAVWMGGAAPAIDADGNVWVASGNGSNISGTNNDYNDSVIELSPTMQPLQFFAPTSWAQDNEFDLDLGSTAPALVGNGLVFQAGKSPNAYLLNQSALGGVGGQVATTTPFCGNETGGGDAVDNGIVYVPCHSGIEAVLVNSSPPSMQVLWRSTSAASGPPIVAGGLIWSISSNGILAAIEPILGLQLQQVSLGPVANHFSTPAVGGGYLLAASADQVHAFAGPLTLLNVTVP